MFTRLKRLLLRAGILLLGVYCCGYALWNMGKTAIFLHESTVLTARVTDMVQFPFESYAQAMAHGNLPWQGGTAYQATVAFTLPTTPVAISIPKMQMPDLDNRDYHVGQEVDIIVPLTDPARAHLCRWKFLWGADCMLLLLGLALGGTGYLLLKRRRWRWHWRKSPARVQTKAAKRRKTRTPRATAGPIAAPVPVPTEAADILPTVSAPAKSVRKSRKKPVSDKVVQAAAEEVFQLVSDPLPPKKKRSRKKKSDA